jgi:hypothetical protein
MLQIDVYSITKVASKLIPIQDNGPARVGSSIS